MSLDAEAIKALLTLPDKRRGGNRKKKGPDTNVRDVTTWFALAPQTRAEIESSNGTLTYEDLKCENPNCVDPRPGRESPLTGEIIKHQFVVTVNGQKICRHCFMDGYLLTDPDQLTITNE